MHPDNEEQGKTLYIETETEEGRVAVDMGGLKVVKVIGNEEACIDGEIIKAHDLELPEMELEIQEVREEYSTPTVTDYEREQEKKARCGSRKRFVKIMMGCGCDRNEANELADLARKWNMPWWVAVWWF